MYMHHSNVSPLPRRAPLIWLKSKSEFGSGAPFVGLPTWAFVGLTREAAASFGGGCLIRGTRPW